MFAPNVATAIIAAGCGDYDVDGGDDYDGDDGDDHNDDRDAKGGRYICPIFHKPVLAFVREQGQES